MSQACEELIKAIMPKDVDSLTRSSFPILNDGKMLRSQKNIPKGVQVCLLLH